MAKSKLQLTMEKDIEDMRQRAQDRRDDAAEAAADALSLEGQIDNYETLISRAGAYEPGTEPDEDEQDEEAQSY